MRVEFKLNFKDLYLYNLTHQLMSPTTHLFFAVPAMAPFFFAEESDSRLVPVLLAVLFYFGAWAVQCLYLLVYLAVLNKKAMLAPKVLELWDDGLLEESTYSKSCYYWPGIVRAVRRPGFIAIYVSGLAAHVIPNRGFTDAIGREKFWAAVNLKLGNAP